MARVYLNINVSCEKNYLQNLVEIPFSLMIQVKKMANSYKNYYSLFAQKTVLCIIEHGY